MKNLFLISLMFFVTSVFGQNTTSNLKFDVEKITNDAVLEMGNNYHDEVCDTLLADGKVYLFRQSPIQYFKGYAGLFKNDEVLIYVRPGEKGYGITWIVKDGQLYIDKLRQLGGFSTFGKKENGELGDINYKLVPANEVKERLEKLTGRKFNNDGRLKADWANGEFGLLTIQPTFQFGISESILQNIIDNQQYYKISFKNGIFGKISRIPYLKEKCIGN